MRKFALATLSAVMLLIFGSGTVFAAPPFHDVIHDSGQDDDFCGTGQTVQVTVDGQISWKDDQGFGHLYRTYTANGVTVVETFSGGGKFTWIDDGDGAYTVKTVREGTTISLRYFKGPTILIETGLMAFLDHFDADDNFLGEDVVVYGGPHPVATDLDLYCETLIEALGI